ncbi:hypothetical protein CDO52_14595 [Nocardiopsis gilva YIM 90087]|uniref:Nuclear transport factor 2 family protein n=1 Tax=Nocardiopsis gilva YIM 90087 TaxID=1235441 RepID=A0A223S726_9ACTN|nr:hypothetical protein [Nocardiopsis gilva]ASU83849.1 hypothetical protein CDO52_14595 [Nocardiopsis gilva YIM 90087]
MTFSNQTNGIATGYTPTAEDLQSLESWFAHYDERAEKSDAEGMENMGMFPMNLVSDDSKGNGVAAQWTREQYLQMLTHEVPDGSADLKTESVRTPVFLSAQLAVVFTEATLTMNGETMKMHYADVLVKSNGEWAYQTMVQSGWGDAMKG